MQPHFKSKAGSLVTTKTTAALFDNCNNGRRYVFSITPGTDCGDPGQPLQ